MLFGTIAGWLAGFFVVKDKGGLLWNIVIGLLGGFVGGLRIQAARWKNFCYALITIVYA